MAEVLTSHQLAPTIPKYPFIRASSARTQLIFTVIKTMLKCDTDLSSCCMVPCESQSTVTTAQQHHSRSDTLIAQVLSKDATLPSAYTQKIKNCAEQAAYICSLQSKPRTFPEGEKRKLDTQLALSQKQKGHGNAKEEAVHRKLDRTKRQCS